MKKYCVDLLSLLVPLLTVMFLMVVTLDAVYADDEVVKLDNGIPVVYVNVDESDEAIEKAEADDPGQDYGTIDENRLEIKELKKKDTDEHVITGCI